MLRLVIGVCGMSWSVHTYYRMLCLGMGYLLFIFFFFQAEDGIRDAQESRGLGDVYKRQSLENAEKIISETLLFCISFSISGSGTVFRVQIDLSLIHI